MTRPITIAACAALAALSCAVLAQTEPVEGTPGQADPAQAEAVATEPVAAEPAAAAATTTALAGNADIGKTLTYTCQGCHGIRNYKNVYPTFHVPMIGGQSEVYLVNALNEYKRGTRKHPTMQAQAQSFSDQDIADIAAFLAGLQPGAAP